MPMYTISPADLQSKSIPEELHRPQNSTDRLTDWLTNWLVNNGKPSTTP